jgi:hypothetical protein
MTNRRFLWIVAAVAAMQIVTTAWFPGTFMPEARAQERPLVFTGGEILPVSGDPIEGCFNRTRWTITAVCAVGEVTIPDMPSSGCVRSVICLAVTPFSH